MFLLAFALNSCKKINAKKMTVELNCGTYLKYLGQRYYVCNSEMLSGYSHGDKVYVSLRKVKHCNSSDLDLISPCMIQKNNGAVEVLEVK
jgi:YHS domain-containing protein